MTWYEMAVAVAGAFGGIELIKFLWNSIFNRKNNSRIANTEATNAEIEVDKHKVIAEAEKIKAMEDAHAVELRQYRERITDLHKTVDKLNEQLDAYVERDAAKEKRFDEQTLKLRDVQGKLYESTQREVGCAKKEVEYQKHIGELGLELEKKRCDYIECPYRKPPTAYTPCTDGRTIDEYYNEPR